MRTLGEEEEAKARSQNLTYQGGCGDKMGGKGRAWKDKPHRLTCDKEKEGT